MFIGLEPIVIRSLLREDEIAAVRKQLLSIPFEEGSVSAGKWAVPAKRRFQAERGPSEDIGMQVAECILENREICQSAFPIRTVHPIFSRYEKGDYYGVHEDNVLQSGARTDLSYTLFLCDPDDYEGGELILGQNAHYSLRSGDVVLYNSGLRHKVRPVTRGVRLVAIGWRSRVRFVMNGIARLWRRFCARLIQSQRCAVLQMQTFKR